MGLRGSDDARSFLKLILNSIEQMEPGPRGAFLQELFEKVPCH